MTNDSRIVSDFAARIQAREALQGRLAVDTNQIADTLAHGPLFSTEWRTALVIVLTDIVDREIKLVKEKETP